MNKQNKIPVIYLYLAFKLNSNIQENFLSIHDASNILAKYKLPKNIRGIIFSEMENMKLIKIKGGAIIPQKKLYSYEGTALTKRRNYIKTMLKVNFFEY